MLCSVVVNNFNYARYLPEAIESALAQSYDNVEVVVVDDGSVDDSPRLIGRYGSRIRAVLKENGGQASALNAGFAVSRGEVVIFLDADDVLLPTAVERVVPLFADRDVVKVHWPLWIIDADGVRTGGQRPTVPLPEGDLRSVVLRAGPSSTGSPPTSGNAWRRGFLDQVCPIPDEYRLCADDYLYALAPAFGIVRRVNDPQACYRLHGANLYQQGRFEEKIRFGLLVQNRQCALLAQMFRKQGIEVDPSVWQPHLWFYRLHEAMNELKTHVPTGSTLILVDDDEWGAGQIIAGRPRRYFIERHGMFWGPPANDTDALDELENLRREGAEFIVFAWPAFWWLDHYAALRQRLQQSATLASTSAQVLIFDLRQRP